MRASTLFLLLLVAVSGLFGGCISSCLPSLTPPKQDPHGTEDPIIDDLVVQGRVSLQSKNSQASALSGATVRVTVDRNQDGVIAANEAAEATTDSEGKYRVQISAPRNVSAVVRFSGDGALPLFRSLSAGPKANVRFNVSLAQAEPLSCDQGSCALDDKSLVLGDLANGISGNGRTFNPVSEREQFPGGFEDANGNLLLSGVFSTVELTDGAGQPVTSLSSPAQLRMELPRDTWRIAKDLHPGTAGIEVPMYAFDEVKGTWVAQGEGVLEDGAGQVLPEARLGAIRAGTYSGVVVAAAKVSHFSSWNVDWPVSTKGCLTGLLLDRDGNPAEGATVTAVGVTYDGSSRGQTLGADGRFCLDVMRSESAGEDVDQDDVTGETQKVALRVSHRGLLYNVGEFPTPVGQGTCAGGGCTDLGTLRLSQDNELIPVHCTYHGTVKDHAGRPQAGTSVMAWDSSIDSDMMMSLCFSGASCDFSATADAQGAYSLSTLVFDTVFATAFKSEQLSAEHSRLATGSVSIRGCPTTPTDITVEVLDSYTLAVSATPTTISWTPAVASAAVMVSDSSGTPKWALFKDGDTSPGLLPPLTYGQTPAGSKPWSPDGGAPSPMVSGDRVEVTAGGTSADGYPYYGSGSATVP